MIQLVSLTKAFGDRVLFDNVTWQISDRDRVGLCGPNGAGKTTLLRMLAGLEELDAGSVVKPSTLTVGYLPQDGLTHSGRTVYEEASLAFLPLLDMRAEIQSIEARLGDPSIPEADHDALLRRYSDLQDRFRMEEGYSLDLKIGTVLHGLGFAQSDWERRTDTFSGGWQMRLALAKLLLARPTLLLLDEPTNHLDLDARNWLESYLADYAHAVILVSHDRFFLDSVATRIAEVNLKTLTDYPGNYSHYLTESRARLDRLRAAKHGQDEEVARMRQFIDRFRYQATKAAQVQSRVKMLEKITPIEVPPERKRVHFSFPSCAKSGRTVFELRKIRKAYGTQVVFGDVSLHVERGDRIALIGRNGAGKSTLMRLLAGVDPPDAGTRQEGHHVVMQYFAQDEAALLRPELTVYETLETGSPMNMVPAIRTILGGFLFPGDDVYKKVSMLSGGERTRLAVARMLLRPSNTLLLDEPTNHLDLDSKDVLLEALEDYGGTLVFVSHDRYFIDRLATRIIDIGDGEARVHLGNYEEFLWRQRRGAEPAPAASPAPARAESSGKRAPARGGSPGGQPTAAPDGRGASPHGGSAGREERKRVTADRRRQERALQARKTRIADLESTIANREQAIKELESQMAQSGFFADHAAAAPVIDRHQALMWEVGELMEEWERLLAGPPDGPSVQTPS